MSRNYALVTIKTLFGEASACAYPDCGEPLIFADRGKKTAIAEIAHIRSEAPGGPRYDADYTEDLDGPDNLLLLCGKHHKPVDRHEIAYSVAELETWKLAQRAKAGNGTPISEADLRSYVVLAPEDRKVLTDVARLSQRVVRSATTGLQVVADLVGEHEKSRMAAWSRSGMAFARYVDDDGNDLGPVGSDGFLLSGNAPVQQRAEIAAAWAPHLAKSYAAVSALEEEVAVLQMTFGSGPVSGAADDIVNAAREVAEGRELQSSVQHLQGLVSRLWRVANGEVDPE